MVDGPFHLPTPQSGTLSRILSGTQPSVQTVSDACLRRTCLLDTSALGTLEVLWRLLRYINLLTYLLTYLRRVIDAFVQSLQNNFKPKLAATLWWFTAAPEPLKIQVLGVIQPPGVAQLLYSRVHN